MREEAGSARTGSRLRRQLAAGIARFIREAELKPGAPLTEQALAGRFGVSRTPIRAALADLERTGLVDFGAARGYRVAAAAPAAGLFGGDEDEDDRLYLAIAHDFVAGRLGGGFSESELQRRYALTKAPLRRVIDRMARDGVVERNAGHGWRFLNMLNSLASHDASYAFRLALEPAAIATPAYRLDPGWAARSRAAHGDLMALRDGRISPVRFFEVNADFHDLVVSGSGNPFFIQAVGQQNRLRRFLDYDARIDGGLVSVNCREHLLVLDALEAGDTALAADRMRRHIARASTLKPTC
ncbi:hypothetical protein OPKNFCMD_5309 [Methylobacterium crusticola]|uniref:HTH gntR-type domain-containing protein n=1 Tax=Methylobacterium crusticola TaxID=1697972 RepID=A0ABQ4R4I2_9HYPH|nr:GntR family transcriptional regulator [Methylobacterium crusticola]GJD52543.1 hypothetical protein OPKNFCMD_5309 [Methylobacterium crusticola]